MIKIITLKEAAKILNYKKTCSAEKWCKENNVIIICLRGSRKKHIVQLQFEHARLKKFIEYLKVKHKEKWLETFTAYMEFDLIQIILLEEERMMSAKTFSHKSNSGTDYKPLSYELKILSRLTSKNTELSSIIR